MTDVNENEQSNKTTVMSTKNSNEMVPLASVRRPKNYGKTIGTGIEWYDELWGVNSLNNSKGVMLGTVSMISALPGCGKSRLLILTGNLICQNNDGVNVGYFTGEQKLEDLSFMAETMDLELHPNLLVKVEKRWEEIVRLTDEHDLTIVIIDSRPLLQFLQVQDIQTGRYRDMEGIEKLEKITELTKKGVGVILINHCTKNGEWAGKAEVMHMIDTSLTMNTNTTDYEGVKMVEIRGGKQRNGIPTERAFPFNGKWDLLSPADVASSKGVEGGKQNEKKVAAKKVSQKEEILAAFAENDNVLTREMVEDNVICPEMPRTSMKAVLREMTEAGEVKAVRVMNRGIRGTAPIGRWELIAKTIKLPEQEALKQAA